MYFTFWDKGYLDIWIALGILGQKPITGLLWMKNGSSLRFHRLSAVPNSCSSALGGRAAVQSSLVPWEREAEQTSSDLQVH